MSVVSVPFVAMALDEAIPIANSFDGFLDALFRG
jgi:hypothetical protein